jgi:16S rRNA U516 pseudouridylate synthase RsuA-like enzyme
MRYEVTMQTGKNRQIRKTFIELDIDVVSLKRTQMGEYALGDLEVGAFSEMKNP